MNASIMATEVGITITVTRTYTWSGDPSDIPAEVLGDWTASGHEDETAALDSLYEVLDRASDSDPSELAQWVENEMDLDDETVTIDEIV